MVSELRQHIRAGKVVYGLRESTKHAKKLTHAYVALDARKESIDALTKNNIEIKPLELTKDELTEKLELDFLCEVFGIKK